MGNRVFKFIVLAGALWVGLYASPTQACAPPPALLQQTPAELLRGLRDDAAPLLAAAEAHATALEACYDGPLGPLELAPITQQAGGVAEAVLAMRLLAEQHVRDNEVAYEELLSSELWGGIENLRVASAYAQAWGQLAAAVRHVSANEKRDALLGAQAALRLLSFEFKHPVLVQRAMYGLATAHVEAGQVEAAKATLQRLQQSLRRGGAPQFKQAADGFLARISAPDFQPPVALLAAEEGTAGAASPSSKITVNAASDALALARQAISEARPADEIVALLRPAFAGDAASQRGALDLLARDQLLLQAMDYEPGQSLRVLQKAFADGQYGQVMAAWRVVKNIHALMPPGLKRQTDYRLGVSLLSLGELGKATAFLQAARRGLAASDAQAQRLDKLIVLAALSIDAPPDAARLALAQKYQDLPLPDPNDKNTDGTAGPPSLDVLLALRARIVLARAAAANKDWQKADQWLSGIGPDLPGYQLFLGMRVRLLAEALKARKSAGLPPAELSKTGRGAATLYALWLNADCPPGCVTGNRLAVHEAALRSAFAAELPSRNFGQAWGALAIEGGDRRPLVPLALDYLLTQRDAARLIALLEDDDEAEAAFILGHWKALLQNRRETDDFAALSNWARTAMVDLQGRPQAVLLEALIGDDLARGEGAAALLLAERLAADFPRRPSAWFWRAAALQAGQRQLEAARALAALARRTPADDPVGMGARLGMAALFIELERGDQACAMRAKIFSRPQAQELWRSAAKNFPMLGPWHAATHAHCPAG